MSSKWMRTIWSYRRVSAIESFDDKINEQHPQEYKWYLQKDLVRKWFHCIKMNTNGSYNSQYEIKKTESWRRTWTWVRKNLLLKPIPKRTKKYNTPSRCSAFDIWLLLLHGRSMAFHATTKKITTSNASYVEPTWATLWRSVDRKICSPRKSTN